MAKFTFNNEMAGTQQAISTSYKTLGSVTALTATLCRGRVFELMFGTAGTPADNSYVFDMSRQTAAGTATAATEVPLDPADGSPTISRSDCFVNYTGEGTITAASSVFMLPINQRASYRWIASPGGELYWPATNVAGFAFRAKSAAGTAIAGMTMYYEDL